MNKEDELSLLIKEEELLKGLVLDYMDKEKLTEEKKENIKFEMSNCEVGKLNLLIRTNIKLETAEELIKKSKALLSKWKREEVKARKKKEKEVKKEKKTEEIKKAINEMDVKSLMYHGNKAEASEIIVKKILKKNKIFTLRHDEKSEIWIYRDGIYVPDGKTYIKEFIRQEVGELITSFFCTNVITKIETDTYIADEDFFINEDPNLVPLQNGIFDLKTKELLPFNDKYFFFNKINVVYDKYARCNNIIRFMKDIVRKEDLKILQEMFGYCLYRDYKYEKAFMFKGSGRNGKGKCVELLKRFLGSENCSNISLQRLEGSNNFDVCELHNKLANISADLSYTALKETGEFKSLTGHDMITAQRKFKTPISFVNYAKMVFCANELPKPSDLTHAFFNRWTLVDFPYTFYLEKEYEENKNEENSKLADTSIIQKISTQEELNGLFNWALEGWDRLKANNCFSDDKTTNQVKKEWIRNADSFIAFCDEYVEEEWEGSVAKQDINRYYSLYCRINKVRPFAEKHVKATLEKTYGAWDTRRNEDDTKVSYWDGIKFKENISELRDHNRKVVEKNKGQGGQEGQLILSS